MQNLSVLMRRNNQGFPYSVLFYSLKVHHIANNRFNDSRMCQRHTVVNTDTKTLCDIPYLSVCLMMRD